MTRGRGVWDEREIAQARVQIQACAGLQRDFLICHNRRTRFQTVAAARTSWKTGKPLEEKPAGLAPSRPSRLKKQREQKSRRPCAGPAAFVAEVLAGFQTRSRLFARRAQYIESHPKVAIEVWSNGLLGGEKVPPSAFRRAARAPAQHFDCHGNVRGTPLVSVVTSCIVSGRMCPRELHVTKKKLTASSNVHTSDPHRNSTSESSLVG